MKKLVTIAIMFFTVASFAQLKVTDVKEDKENIIGEYKIAGKSYTKIVREGEYCVFLYRDENYKTIDIYKHFIFKYSDLDAMYNLFANYDGIKKGDKKKVEIDGGDVLNFYYDKMFGQWVPRVIHTDKDGLEGQIRNLSPKQYKELFGK